MHVLHNIERCRNVTLQQFIRRLPRSIVRGAFSRQRQWKRGVATERNLYLVGGARPDLVALFGILNELGANAVNEMVNDETLTEDYTDRWVQQLSLSNLEAFHVQYLANL